MKKLKGIIGVLLAILFLIVFDFVSGKYRIILMVLLDMWLRVSRE